MARPEVVCCHEAGHVVAFLAHRIPIENMWIDDQGIGPPGDWQGQIYPTGLQSIDARLNVLVTLAGRAADEKRFGPGFRRGDECDLKEARRQIEKERLCPPEKVDAFMEEMLGEARRFVENNWATIERIGNHLAAKVQRAIEDKPYPRKLQIPGDTLQEWFDNP